MLSCAAASVGLAEEPRRAEPSAQLGAPLSYPQQRALAERFAPELVFHPDESYFPMSPLFTIESQPHLNAMVAQSFPWRSRQAYWKEALGTQEMRRVRYGAMTLEEKLALATVYFQAYRLEEDPRIVVEFWLYYLQNHYRPRNGLIPLRVDTSHSNDMEHVFLILEPEEGQSTSTTELERYRLAEIYASAHGDKVPNNHLSVPASEAGVPPPSILVELGAHAMAPDLDRDGRFTPGIDSQSGPKFVWGIRDHGDTWTRYSASYMLPRADQAIVLRAPGDERRSASSDAAAKRPQGIYRLQHAEELADTFGALALDPDEMAEAFYTSTAWFKRFFGASNGGPEKLVLPTAHEDFGEPRRMRESYLRNEQGLTTGFTVILSGYTFFAGGRMRLATTPSPFPDLSLDAQAFLTVEGYDFYTAELLGFYPLDASTKFFFGVGFITDSLSLDGKQVDWIAGLEWDLGRFRFRNAFRSTGEVSQAWLDFRVYFFPFN